MKVSVSFLKSKLPLKETISSIMETDADFLHVDIMDGVFVPAKSMPIDEISELLQDVAKPLDIHLMVENPLEYIPKLATLNTRYITFHSEINVDTLTLVSLIHQHGIRAGLAINPMTPISRITPYLNFIDYVLIMGVNPGRGGQAIIDETISKIVELDKIRNSYQYHFLIGFDGGVNSESITKLDGVDIAVAGSFICMSDDYQHQIDLLKKK